LILYKKLDSNHSLFLNDSRSHYSKTIKIPQIKSIVFPNNTSFASHLLHFFISQNVLHFHQTNDNMFCSHSTITLETQNMFIFDTLKRLIVPIFLPEKEKASWLSFDGGDRTSKRLSSQNTRKKHVIKEKDCG